MANGSRLKWYERETHEERMEALDEASISFAFSVVATIIFLVGFVALIYWLFN